MMGGASFAGLYGAWLSKWAGLWFFFPPTCLIVVKQKFKGRKNQDGSKVTASMTWALALTVSHTQGGPTCGGCLGIGGPAPDCHADCG